MKLFDFRNPFTYKTIEYPKLFGTGMCVLLLTQAIVAFANPPSVLVVFLLMVGLLSVAWSVE